MATGGGSPCGACKFLRRRCVAECVFAPYFCSDQGPARFAAIHKVFGASNVSKLLLQLPPHQRYAAVVSISFEAQARLDDPIYGCVSHIVALQEQVINLQAEVMQARAVQAQFLANLRNAGNQQWASSKVGTGGTASFPAADPAYLNLASCSWPQNSPYSTDHYNGGIPWKQEEISSGDDLAPFPAEGSSRKRALPSDMGELQALALRMTKTEPKF